MKNSVRYFIAFFSIIVLNPVQASEKESAVKALTEARKLMEKNVAIEGGWQSTKKLITKATLSIDKGNYDQAKKLADKAIREAHLSYKQAQRESKNWSEPDYLSK